MSGSQGAAAVVAIEEELENCQAGCAKDHGCDFTTGFLQQADGALQNNGECRRQGVTHLRVNEWYGFRT